MGTRSQPSEVASPAPGSREQVDAPTETRIARLPAGVLLTPIKVAGEAAQGIAEVEWTLGCLTPLISDWPESPLDEQG